MGKNKIKQAFKQKQVSDYCITKALKEIGDADYIKTFEKLVEQKMKTLKSEKNIFIKKKKLQDFLLMKRYESELVNWEMGKMGRDYNNCLMKFRYSFLVSPFIVYTKMFKELSELYITPWNLCDT